MATSEPAVTVVVGIDGSGRSHQLALAAAAVGGAAVELPDLTDAEQVRALADGVADDGALLVVDDAHARPSEVLVEVVAACRREARVVIARRPGTPEPVLATLEELALRGGRVRRLGPLGPAEVTAIVRRAASPTADPDTLLARSAGAAWVVAALVHGGSLGRDELRAAVERRLARLGEGARSLATLLAVVDELAAPVTGDVLSRALAAGRRALGGDRGDRGESSVVAESGMPDSPAEQYAAACRELWLTGLLARQEPFTGGESAAGPEPAAGGPATSGAPDLDPAGPPTRDALVPAVSEAIRAGLTIGERQRSHALVAVAATAAGADVPVLAASWRAAAVRSPQAVAALAAAAHRSAATDPIAALPWAQAALDAAVGLDEAARGRLLAQRADALALLGRATARDVEPSPRAAAHRAARDGRPERVVDRLLTGSEPLTRVTAVPTLVALGLVDRARQLRGQPGQPEQPGQPGEPGQPGQPEHPDRPEQPGDAGRRPPADRSIAWTVEGLLADGALLLAERGAAAALPRLIEAAERAESDGTSRPLPDTPHALGGLVAVAAGDSRTGERLLRRARAAGAGGPAAVVRHDLLASWVGLRAGRSEPSPELLAAPAGPTESAARSMPVAAAGPAAPTAPPGSAAPQPTAGLVPRDELTRTALVAAVARRRGDVVALRRCWESVATVLSRRSADLPAVELVEELAVGAARLGEQRHAEPLLAQLIESARTGPASWRAALAWLRLQVAVVADDADAAAAAARDVAAASADPAAGVREQAQATAARAWADALAGEVDGQQVLAAVDSLAVAAELPWEAGRLAGQAAVRTADPRVARRLLERARELAGSSTVGGESRAGESSADPAVATALSEREVEVARLVLAGRTHREIGGQLYISPKTVEHHVARIRTKVGARSRAELLAALRSLVEAPDG